MTKKRTKADFINELNERRKDEFTVLGEYIDSKTKILIKHNSELCNYYEYMVFPSNVLKGGGCPKCAKIKRLAYGDKQKLIEKIQIKAKELGRVPHCNEMENPSTSTYINVFGSWTQALKKAGLKITCQICNKEFETEKSNTKYCPECRYERRKELTKIAQRKRFEGNPEKLKEYREKQSIYAKSKRNDKEFLEKEKERAKNYYEKNKEKVIEKGKQYRLINREKINAYGREYTKKYRQENLEKVRERERIRKNRSKGYWHEDENGDWIFINIFE